MKMKEQKNSTQKDTSSKIDTSKLWEEHIDPRTGQSSLKVHNLTKISQFDTCDHYFEINGNDAICKKCGLGQPIIVGKQFIKDGKIIKLSPSS